VQAAANTLAKDWLHWAKYRTIVLKLGSRASLKQYPSWAGLGRERTIAEICDFFWPATRDLPGNQSEQLFGCPDSPVVGHNEQKTLAFARAF